AVLMQFWINKALVGAGLLAKFSAAYWALSAITIIAQLSMVALLIWLNRRHFGFASAQTVPAE
ncbi:MAG: hypothetical protein RL128_813, partial [Pseudomonadota bacterium]